MEGGRRLGDAGSLLLVALVAVGDGDVAQLGVPVVADAHDGQLVALPAVWWAERVADGVQDRKAALPRGDGRVHLGPVQVDLAFLLGSGAGLALLRRLLGCHVCARQRRLPWDRSSNAASRPPALAGNAAAG